VLITHDRSLIDLVADRLWLTADGQINAFKGDMDDYARFVLDRARTGKVAPSQDTGGKDTAMDGADSAQKQAERDAARKAAKKKRRRGL